MLHSGYAVSEAGVPGQAYDVASVREFVWDGEIGFEEGFAGVCAAGIECGVCGGCAAALPAGVVDGQVGLPESGVLLSGDGD